jgi:hypothetical protein
MGVSSGVGRCFAQGAGFFGFRDACGHCRMLNWRLGSASRIGNFSIARGAYAGAALDWKMADKDGMHSA